MDNEWLPIAQALADGGRERVPHSCGDGDSLLISREGKEFRAYCFRCKMTGFHREQESLAERLERIAREGAADAKARTSISLPEPQLPLEEAPLALKVWFYKQGLSPRMIAELGLYWCPDMGRVVLPIMQDGHAVFWMARALKRTPKWIAPDVPKRGLVARYGVGKGDTIVVCEDPLSAYKVGQITEAWSLLGTALADKVAVELVKSGKRIATWLDDDLGRKNRNNPGQEAASTIRGRLRALGVDVRNITSPKDPKYYGRDYIQEKLA